MKYYVLTPWGETGGLEALHQICSTLNEIGEESFIYYYDNNASQTHKDEFVPKYSEYNLKSCDVGNIASLDEDNNVLIVPEVFPIKFIENLQNCKIVFWRLSIFTHGQEINLPAFQKVYHGCQSDTSFNILKESGLFNERQFFMLSDYINLIYLQEEKNLKKNRENIILFNPKKGIKHTQNILSILSKKVSPEKNIKVVPLSGMTNFQIRNLILNSKIYIDFGDHPGKDRIPRECASGGCVVITGTQQCGKNNKDIPIETKFEYNQHSDSYDYDSVADFILKSIDEYDFYFEQQKEYRNLIRKEKEIFSDEVKKMVSIISRNEV